MSASLEIKFNRRFSEVSNSYILWVQVINASPMDLFYCLKVRREIPDEGEPEKLVSLATLPELNQLLYQRMDCLYAQDLYEEHFNDPVGKEVIFYPPPPVIREFTGDVPISRVITGLYYTAPIGSTLFMASPYYKLSSPMNSYSVDAPFEIAALSYSGVGTIQRAPQRYPYSREPYSRDFVHINEYDSLGDVTTLFEKLKDEAQTLVDTWNTYEDDFEGTRVEVFE